MFLRRHLRGHRLVSSPYSCTSSPSLSIITIILFLFVLLLLLFFLLLVRLTAILLLHYLSILFLQTLTNAQHRHLSGAHIATASIHWAPTGANTITVVRVRN